MLFMIRQGAEIDFVAADIHFFRAPEERQLLFDQFLEYFVLLLIVTGHVNRLTEKHRFAGGIVGGLTKN